MFVSASPSRASSNQLASLRFARISLRHTRVQSAVLEAMTDSLIRVSLTDVLRHFSRRGLDGYCG
jgi:hypothetical protein